VGLDNAGLDNAGWTRDKLVQKEPRLLLILLVGVGGFVGAVMRYAVINWVQYALHTSTLPYGTLTVNVIGCLVIGLLGGLSESRNLLTAETRALLLIGVLGGFTTYSTFGYETVQLLRDGESLTAFSNIGLQVCLGLVAVWIGYSVSQVGT
jgi:CrcB protein